jgi:ubiquinone/menaquinone biosynthesis C-methylase UbiE
MEWDREQATRKIIERIANSQAKRVLEIGCGDGKVTSAFVGKSKKIVAIDTDKAKIAKVKKKIKNVDFRIGTGECLAFKKESFDLVLFSLSLHHQDSRVALKEAHRVLRQNGQLIIMEPAVDGDVQQFVNLFINETQKLKKALDEIEASDFRLEKKESFYINWIFENKEEVYDYDFDRQDLECDDSIIQKMNELLGERINAHPIILIDKISLFSLSKRRN